MPNQTPIPTQINIAPSGMTWKNWKLVQGTDGFPTRETMEKYLCNPDRVRDLEECRDLNLQTIKQLEALIQLYEAQMEAVGAGGVEPLRKQAKLREAAFHNPPPALNAPVLPEKIPSSDTLWQFLTKGVSLSAIHTLSEHDQNVYRDRAAKTWATICSEATAASQPNGEV